MLYNCQLYCCIVQCLISLIYLFWYQLHSFPPLTAKQYLQYVYLDFNLNVPISWRCITCLIVLTGNSFSKYDRMTGSIVALFLNGRCIKGLARD